MRRSALAAIVLLWLGCGAEPGVDVPGREGALKTAARERAERRLYDGAPPVIPHQGFSSPCTSCHNAEGMAVAGMGFSPPSPHEITAGLSATSNCRQCHVERQTAEVFVESGFVGLAQNLRRGRRLSDVAPPVTPHPLFMRENCVACHSGPAAREEIRTPHPERERCVQCHVTQQVAGSWPVAG